MFVVATAGHVDHGKSTLVRALTGMEPDRWAEERRRGMTIDLGFAWTTLPSGATIAFVDVPGHERFVPNMLAGVGPVPAALIVVAADEGWMPQSAEHLAALDALDVGYGLLAVTRADLADPGPATARARAEIAATSRSARWRRWRSAAAPAPACRSCGPRWTGSPPGCPTPHRGRSGPALGGPRVHRAGQRHRRHRHARRRPAARRRRAGAGRRRGAGPGPRPALPRRGPSRGRRPWPGSPSTCAGSPRDRLGRGDALLTPGRFHRTDVIDVRLTGDPAADLPATLTLHVGSAAVPVRVRPLGVDTVRLRLARPLPLLIGDRALLRDPGRHHVAGGVRVLDVAPPPLTRRGAAAARASVLADLDGRPDLAGELRRRRLVRVGTLRRMGVPVQATPVAGDWLADPGHWQRLGDQLTEEVGRYAREHPLEPGMPVDALRQRLALPDRALVEALVRPPLRIHGGRVAAASTDTLPEPVARAVQRVRAEYADRPFRAPEADRLADLGLGPREIGAAVRAGALLRLADTVVLLPDALDDAVAVLAGLPQPFTLSAAPAGAGHHPSGGGAAAGVAGPPGRHPTTARRRPDRRHLSS